MRSYGAKRDANEKAIIRALQSQGWSVFPMSQPGFPDLLCVKSQSRLVLPRGLAERADLELRVRLVEVKEPRKKLTGAQAKLFPSLEASGLCPRVVVDPFELTGSHWRDYHARTQPKPRPSKKGRAA